MKSRALVLRELIARPQGVSVPGITVPLDAYIAELIGLLAGYGGGFAQAGQDGKPDRGFISRDGMIGRARRIVSATSLPILFDIDDGYGDALIARDTVRELLETVPNLAAFHIEDQRFPKRCGHIAGKDVLPLDEFLGKLDAVLDMREKLGRKDVSVVARTDAFSAASGKKDKKLGGDIREVVKRLCAYKKLGADVGWAETPDPRYKVAEEIALRVRDKFPDFPLAYNVSPSFSHEDWERWADETSDERLNDLGYKLRFITYFSLVVQVWAVESFMRVFKDLGATRTLREIKRIVKGTLAENIMKLVGVPEALELERRFIPGSGKKQKHSEGFGA